MRVFLVHEDIYNAGNPYIYTLVESIMNHHTDIQFGWGWDPFWSDEIFSYDAVHFQWPQAYMTRLDKENAALQLERRLKQLHDRGIKIFATCHDLKPHYDQCKGYDRCISVVYSNSDVVFHLGDFSRNLFNESFPNAINLVLPHHVYDTVYKFFPSKEESVKQLNLDPSVHYVLCFGAFRSDEERNLILFLAKQLKRRKEKYKILAPAFLKVKRHHRHVFSFIPTKSFLKYLYYKHCFGIIMTGESWVPINDEILPYYYGAADVAVIQRLSVLNSGNAVLALLFDKPVVGPNVGNVNGFIRSFGYPAFDVSDYRHTLMSAFNEAVQLGRQGYPQTLRNRVASELSTDVVSEKLYHYYKGDY